MNLLEAAFLRCGLGVHVAQDGGDGVLFDPVWRNTKAKLSYLFRIRRSECAALFENSPTLFGMNEGMEQEFGAANRLHSTYPPSKTYSLVRHGNGSNGCADGKQQVTCIATFANLCCPYAITRPATRNVCVPLDHRKTLFS